MGGFAAFPSGSVPPFPFLGRLWLSRRLWSSSRRAASFPSSASRRSHLWGAPTSLFTPRRAAFVCLKEWVVLFLVPSIPAAILVDFSICADMTACRLPKARIKPLRLKDMGVGVRVGGITITTLALGHILQGDLLPESFSCRNARSVVTALLNPHTLLRPLKSSCSTKAPSKVVGRFGSNPPSFR